MQRPYQVLEIPFKVTKTISAQAIILILVFVDVDLHGALQAFSTSVGKNLWQSSPAAIFATDTKSAVVTGGRQRIAAAIHE